LASGVILKEKVAVIGAGTAGLILARETAARGINTTVYDQKKVLGVPVRASGILSIKGLEGLGIDYLGGVTNTLYGARVHAGKQVMNIRSRRPVAVVLDRRKLNEICFDDAVAEGAAVRKGRRISDNILDGISKESIVVGADGAISSVARHFSMGPVGRFVTTYKADFRVKIDDPGMVDLFFDNELTQGLFAWLCPNADDILEVGVGIDSQSGNARKAFEKFLLRKEVGKMLHNARLMDEGASIIPTGLRKRIVDNEREVLLVGDAAGQVKHTTGGGIIFGGHAALIAAGVIEEHIRNGADLSLYEKAFKKQFGNEMMLHHMIQRFYSSISSARLGNLMSLLNALGIESFLGEYGDMDRPSLMMKRFFLRGLVNQ
jgi:digeranylgeranylglycerophospholipid reductase